jgi:hypothetical protein
LKEVFLSLYFLGGLMMMCGSSGVLGVSVWAVAFSFVTYIPEDVLSFVDSIRLL